MKALAAFLLFAVATIAIAGTTSTIVNNTATFHEDGKAAVTVRATADKTALALCFEMAKAPLVAHSTCTDVYGITNVPDCADVKAPNLPLVKNADGFWEEPQGFAQLVQGSDTVWTTVQNLFVHNPAWPLGMPNCWVRGLAPSDEWRVNGSNPSAVFMERKYPGIADVIDPPNSDEPVCGQDVTDPRCPPWVPAS